jgi:thiol-disulfide isomerase/thioredoxin
VPLGQLACGARPPPPSEPRSPAALPTGAPPTASSAPALDAVATPAAGWLGIELATDPLGRGVEIRSVLPGSPAEACGMKPGDLVTRLDGEEVRAPTDLAQRVRERGAGARVGVALLRQGEPHLVAARLAPRPEPDDLVRREFLGRLAPDFGPLEPALGEPKVSLGAYRGKVVVLEFWAPWCAVCRVLAPELTNWHRAVAAHGGMVLGIAAESTATATSGAAELGIEYPVLADERGDTTARYRAFALPTMFLIDREGVVRDVLVGYDAAAFGALLAHAEGLLASPSGPTDGR